MDRADGKQEPTDAAIQNNFSFVIRFAMPSDVRSHETTLKPQSSYVLRAAQLLGEARPWE
jgi:hypothetical protein